MERLHTRRVTAVARRLRVFPADGEPLLNSLEEQRRIAKDNKVTTARGSFVVVIVVVVVLLCYYLCACAYSIA